MVLVAQQAASALFWWHPGVWLLNRSVSRAREELCDNHVLHRSDPADYAQLLLDLAEAFSGRGLALSLLGLLSPRWRLEHRIAGLLDPRRNRTTRAGRLSIALAAGLLTTLCLAVGGSDALRGLRAAPPATPPVSQKSGELIAFADQPAAATEAPPSLSKVTPSGTCEDEDQRPLAGINVRVFRYPSPIDPPLQVAETTTDPQGRFVVEDVETDPGQLESRGIADLVLAATADDRASAVKYVNDEQQLTNLTLTLHSETGTLSGVVRDEQGQPVAGATVQLPSGFSHPLPGIMSTITDEQGRYAITNVPQWRPGEFETKTANSSGRIVMTACFLFVHHEDFAVTLGKYTAVPQSVDVTLHPPAIVTGRVLDVVTNQPAAGVFVSAQGIARHGWAQVRTDSDGRYRLLLTKDHYNIWAEMPERIAVAAKAIDAKPGETTPDADIRLVRGVFVYGQLIDPGTNKPIQPDERTYVAHYGPARPRSGAAVSNTVVQPDGSYRLRVAPGRNFIYLQSGPGGGVELEIQDGADVHHDFQIGEHSENTFASPDPEIKIGDRIRQQARDEDAVADRLTGNTPAAPVTRERGDTPVGRLLNELEQQNAGDELFAESWLKTLRQIVDLGPAAVPELITELDATANDMMLRCLGFALRAIGDKRAVPALIRAIPKTLLPPGSDMGVLSNDAQLALFAQQHDLDNSKTGNEYVFGRPVREVFGSLEQLTGQKFNEEELYSVHLLGTQRQKSLQRQLYDRCARRWSDWWEEHWSEHVDNAEYARVKLPEAPAAAVNILHANVPHYKSGESFSNYLLESALSQNAGRHELFDLDTGRGAAVPGQWRRTIGGEGYGQFVAWASEQGFDLLGHEYVVPGTGRHVYAIRRLSGQFWELPEDAWKRTYDDTTFGELQRSGRPVADHWLLHRDSQTGDIDPLARATFLFQTNDDTRGIVYVGVEVQDDAQQPGGSAEGDNELTPIAFNKGRRFAFTFLEELGAPDKRISRAGEQPQTVAATANPLSAAADSTNLGAIAGQFVLEGDVPDPRRLTTVGGVDVPDESLIVDPDSNGIANICLYLESAPAVIPPALQKSSRPTVTFDVNQGRFVPHILLVRTDQQVLLMNNDSLLTNTHAALLKNSSINMVIRPKERKGVAVGTPRPETVPAKIASDIQPWMSAYWVVTDHPYVAVTDAAGKFTIRDLPAGEHSFRVWHERAGFLKTDAFPRELKVSLQPGATIELPVFHIKTEELCRSQPGEVTGGGTAPNAPLFSE
ncbi:MAG: carboxypeptidase regulatory-like domain-containing protein [Planctomycetaceae bacterium]